MEGRDLPSSFFRTGAYFEKYGSIVLPNMDQKFARPPGAPISDGDERPTSGFAEEFLGVYSGRINAESDLGFVWRPSAVRDIIEKGRVARW
jgi:hypothetical protein